MNIRFEIFFFYEFSKSRDKAGRNIYNFQFRSQLENLCGWFSYSKQNQQRLTY
jgi:hypothetical protein